MTNYTCLDSKQMRVFFIIIYVHLKIEEQEYSTKYSKST